MFKNRVLTSSRMVLLAGMTLATVMVAALLAVFAQERHRAIDEQLDRNEMFARVLEEHATRSVESAALALATLAARAGEQGYSGSASSQSALAQTLVSLPQLRAIAVLDKQGLVLASSVSGEVGMRVEVGRLGAIPANAKDAIGPFIAGRGLGALRVGHETPPSPPSVGFIPLVRRVDTSDGVRLLVALIHPDWFANHMRLTIQDSDTQALLTSFDGRALTSTEGVAANTSLADHRVFSSFLPDFEHGRYRGPGVGPGEQTGAYRVSRTRPLVVLVERPLADVVRAWIDDAYWRMLIAVLAVIAVPWPTWAAARYAASRERARLRLDDAQATVARREHELSVIVASVQEMLFKTDAQGRLTFVNEHESAAGRNLPDELVGRAFETLVTGEERSAVQALFRLDGTGTRRATVTLSGAEGRSGRFDVAVVPLFEAGQVVAFAGSAVDITEREEAQSRLAAQLEFSALLRELSPLPTSMLDTQGRYVTVNRAWLAFTGRPIESVIGSFAAARLQPDVARMHDSRDRELLERGGSLSYEARYTHPNGTVVDLLINKVQVPGLHGKPLGILCTFMDVSELRNAARVTQEAREAAEESSRAKSEFIANISHELRTPLQSIMGFAELGTLRARGHEQLAGMFTDILASGRRMLALVNDLLDVSKIESAVGPIHLERSDLQPLMREVVTELGPQLAAGQITCRVEAMATTLFAQVDPLRFQQVIRNVLANAIKFSPRGAAVELEAGRGDDGCVRISVRDRGPGIPAAEVETIFEAFVQSSKTKDGSGGTGLGLAICRKIVAAHGGRIHAENMAGGGSCFHIVLPERLSTESLLTELAT